MTRNLKFFRWSWIGLVVLLTSAPYLINWWSTPPGQQYTWIIPPYPEDSFGYKAWAQQAAHGAWLFKIKYTALPHSPFLFNPFFLLCGWMSALFRLDIGIVFLLVKVVGTVLFLATFYRYSDFLRLNETQSVTATILLGFSSGLGGLLTILGLVPSLSVRPADLWMPEMSTFWSLLWNPLFPWSLLLILLSIYWLDRGTAQGRPSDLYLSGLVTGIMALVHPYFIPLVFTMVIITVVVRKKLGGAGYLFRYFALAAPFVIYVFVASRANALIAQHSVTGAMPSPPVTEYLLGLGVPLLLVIAGVVIGRGKFLKRYWQLVLWLVLSLLLAYFPFWFQRKLMFGAHIPLSILAALAFNFLLARWSTGPIWRTASVLAVMILLPLSMATPVYVLIRQARRVKANSEGAYYVSNEIMDGLKILQQRSKPSDVIFAAYTTSRLIPAYSGNTVLWGHWAMSVDLQERVSWLKNVFEQASDEGIAEKFWGSDIQYVFMDGEISGLFQTHPYLARLIFRDAHKIFENKSVAIYQRPDFATR
jgi:hypothetical protein